MKQVLDFTINGLKKQVYVEPWWTLDKVLREELGLMGLKIGCAGGACGSCTVLIDGKAVKSCLYPAMKARQRDIVTIEGLKAEGGLHPIQQAFIDHFALQCGYCTPAMILTTKALLDENPDPTDEEVKDYLSGNLCRCTGYVKIVEAVLVAKDKMKARR